jgi:hypothetical protein
VVTLAYTHCRELMKSLGSHYTASFIVLFILVLSFRVFLIAWSWFT